MQRIACGLDLDFFIIDTTTERVNELDLGAWGG